MKTIQLSVHQTLPTTDLTPITLYDSDPSEDKSPIYIDFAKAENA